MRTGARSASCMSISTGSSPSTTGSATPRATNCSCCVAERLKVASRGHDAVGRLGGDEFLVLLREIPDADIAMRVAHRICEALCRPFELAGGMIELGASIGVACARGRTISAEELVNHADSAMYQSKEHGECLPVLAGSTAPEPRAHTAPRAQR